MSLLESTTNLNVELLKLDNLRSHVLKVRHQLKFKPSRLKNNTQRCCLSLQKLIDTFSLSLKKNLINTYILPLKQPKIESILVFKHPLMFCVKKSIITFVVATTPSFF